MNSTKRSGRMKRFTTLWILIGAACLPTIGYTHQRLMKEMSRNAPEIQEVPQSSSSKIEKGWRPTETWVNDCIKSVLRSPEVRPFHVPLDKYALGDCVKMCHCKYFPSWPEDATTFLHTYDKLACRNVSSRTPYGNLTLVQQIMDQSEYTVRPPPDELVIHLRLGDVIELSDTPTVGEMLWKGGNPKHNRNFQNSIKPIGEYLDNIAEANVSHVHFRGGSHVGEHYKKSRVYAGCLKRAVVKAGYNVTMVIDSGDPDGDFYYMTHAKWFVAACGGYSRIIGKYVKLHGGTVIGRTF